MKSDNPSIESDDYLYRRPPDIPVEYWTKKDEGGGAVRISSGALTFQEDGLSCYCRSTLWLNFSCSCTVKTVPQDVVVRLGVGDVRELGFGVADDPSPDYISPEDSSPRDTAHVLVVYDETMSRSQLDKRRSKLAKRTKVVHAGSVASLFAAAEGHSEPKSGWDVDQCSSGGMCRCVLDVVPTAE